MKNIKKRKKKTFKELRFHPNIAQGDLNTKVRQIRKFLGKSLQVRITVQMRGREITHKEVTHNLLNRISDATQDIGRMDSARRESGRSVTTMISPIIRK